MAYTPSNFKRTLSEEKNYELAKAKRTLKKMKEIEAKTPMFCATVNKAKICASSEERLNEIINELKNR